MSGTEQVIRNTLKTKEKKRKIHKIDLNERQKINFVIQHVYVCLCVTVILENQSHKDLIQIRRKQT